MTTKKYHLKKNQPAFDIVDGPMAGQKFTHGVSYSLIPKGEAHKFEIIKPAVTPTKDVEKKGDHKK